MPSRVSNGAQGVTPVIVEVKPQYAGRYTPTPPSSPKAVRFAPSSAQEVSRPLTNKEEWSLRHFEHHARECQTCFDPWQIYKDGARLCPEGHALAQDVAINVFYRSGSVYATRKEDHKLVRVEVKPGYGHVKGLLKSMDHHLRSRPVISYDRTYPVSARYPAEEYKRNERSKQTESVIVEPATSRRSSQQQQQKKTRHPSRRYETIVVDDDVDAATARTTAKKSKEHRGSLYEGDVARMERERRYRVEVREPESSSSRRWRRDRYD